MTAAQPARPGVVDRWHHVVEHRDLAALDALVADDAVFSSPAVHRKGSRRSWPTSAPP
ncbi:hypothetical protein SAMN04490239_5161 [Rhodococcus koreensis]|uniref:SnoaL-like domain-containing protein n=1 Tax=Rhodococcus koreensis TaxID=99653 RepID=A0A1H4UT76_9NOCA|nr:hypothetical protein SAMN04490239_5161 [Rhodococcus koreensis]